jgi:hypothetical protein
MNELEGAFRRHNRANEHLENLDALIGQLRQLCENGVLAEEDPKTGLLQPSEEILGPLKLDAGVLIGEIAGNLRASLDYLVYVLAANDAGDPQRGTQFPIEDTAQGFTGKRPRFLAGVSDEHVAVIRQFQPYKGCEWTGALRDIDNAAKHREVLSVDVDLSVASVLTLAEHSLGGELNEDGHPADLGMSMYVKGPVKILLPEGRPIMETLQLHFQTGLLLHLFTFEFPGG